MYVLILHLCGLCRHTVAGPFGVDIHFLTLTYSMYTLFCHCAQRMCKAVVMWIINKNEKQIQTLKDVSLFCV